MSRGLGFAHRLRKTLRIFLFVFVLSAIGFVVEMLFQVFSPSIILLTDVSHWAIDLTLEAIFMLVVCLASRVSRRFYWTAIIIEMVAIILAIIVVLAIYGLFFLDYLIIYST